MSESSEIMKTLFLMRHAKSDWSKPFQDDFDRGLNTRGKKDVIVMSSIVKRLEKEIDHFYVSTAERAKKTIHLIENYLEKKLTYTDQLYTFDGADYISFVKALPSNYNSVLLLGHNPSLEYLVSYLLKIDAETIRIPTSCLLQISLSQDSWNTNEHSATLKYLINPKLIHSIVKD